MRRGGLGGGTHRDAGAAPRGCRWARGKDVPTPPRSPVSTSPALTSNPTLGLQGEPGVLSRGAAEPGDPPPPPRSCSGRWSPTTGPRRPGGQGAPGPTVRATVTSFSSEANRVLTTCLGDRSMSARHRARVGALDPRGQGIPREGPGTPLQSGTFLFLENCVYSLPAGHCAAGWVGGEGSFRPTARSACPHETRPHCSLCFKERAPQLPRNVVLLGRSSGPGGCPGRQVWDSPLCPQSQRTQLATLFTAV